MAFLPPLKIRRHIPITLALLLLFTKDLKEIHIKKMHSWIDRKVVYFVIQAHHIPAFGVLVLVLIIFYIEGGIDKSVNWYGYYWDIGGEVVSIYVEVPIEWTVDSRNGAYTIVGALDWFFYELEKTNLFTLIKKSGSSSSRTGRSIFLIRVWLVLPYQLYLRL